MIFYMICLLKFRICLFLAQVTLETSQVYYDNCYHDFFLTFFTQIVFLSLINHILNCFQLNNLLPCVPESFVQNVSSF